MQDKEQKMATEKIGKLMLSMAVPSIVAQIINILYSIVDRIYIGHIEGVGMEALTGVGVTFPIVTLVSAFSAFVGAGGAPLAAIWLGKGDRKRAEKILGNGVTMLLFFTVVLMTFFYLFQKPLLYVFGASDATIGYAVDYMTIYLMGTIFVELALGLNAFIISQGRSRTAMTAVLIGAAANIILDPIMIFGIGHFPAMGIAGAAYATGIGQCITLIVYLLFYFFSSTPIQLHSKYLRFDSKLILKIYSIGVSATLNLALPSLLISILNGLLASFSEKYVLVLGVYYKLQTFIYLTANGIIQGIRPLLGYNFGAGEYTRVKKIFYTSLIMNMGIMAVGMILSWLMPAHLIGLFTDNPDTIHIGITALHIISMGFIISAISITCSGALEGLGKGTQSLLISLLRYVIVMIPASYGFSRFLGADGVWYGFCLTEFITAGFAALIYWKQVLCQLREH